MRALELRIPPVIVVLLLGAGMWWAARAAPSLTALYPGRNVLALVFLLLGICVIAAALREFKRHQTTPDPTRPEKSTAIVTGGIYGMSRNPMYLGMVLLLVAWGVYLSNALVAAGPVAFVLYMNRFQIAPEERVLTRTFGAPFEEYLRTVRRWI